MRIFCFSIVVLLVNQAACLVLDGRFQRLIISGETSYFTASSLRVSRSLMASKATFALNFASYFFLVPFMGAKIVKI